MALNQVGGKGAASQGHRQVARVARRVHRLHEAAVSRHGLAFGGPSGCRRGVRRHDGRPGGPQAARANQAPAHCPRVRREARLGAEVRGGRRSHHGQLLGLFGGVEGRAGFIQALEDIEI